MAKKISKAERLARREQRHQAWKEKGVWNGKKLRVERRNSGNATITTWFEPDFGFDMEKRLEFREQHKDELPPMDGFGYRITDHSTGEVNDYTFDTDTGFAGAYLD